MRSAESWLLILPSVVLRNVFQSVPFSPHSSAFLLAFGASKGRREAQFIYGVVSTHLAECGTQKTCLERMKQALEVDGPEWCSVQMWGCNLRCWLMCREKARGSDFRVSGSSWTCPSELILPEMSSQGAADAASQAAQKDQPVVTGGGGGNKVIGGCVNVGVPVYTNDKQTFSVGIGGSVAGAVGPGTGSIPKNPSYGGGISFNWRFWADAEQGGPGMKCCSMESQSVFLKATFLPSSEAFCPMHVGFQAQKMLDAIRCTVHRWRK